MSGDSQAARSSAGAPVAAGAGPATPKAPRPDADAAALIVEIGKEAEAQKAQILAEARERARALLEAADAKIAAATADAERSMEKRARIDADRLLGDVQLAAAAERLRARKDAYQKVVAAAGERIKELARDAGAASGARDALRALLAEALAKAPGEARVRVASSNREACEQALKALGRICEIETEDAEPGTVIVTSKDGRRTVDNSLGVRLERASQSKEAQIAALLFGEK